MVLHETEEGPGLHTLTLEQDHTQELEEKYLYETGRKYIRTRISL